MFFSYDTCISDHPISLSTIERQIKLFNREPDALDFPDSHFLLPFVKLMGAQPPAGVLAGRLGGGTMNHVFFDILSPG
jgi:hypothetical protein